MFFRHIARRMCLFAQESKDERESSAVSSSQQELRFSPLQKEENYAKYAKVT